MTDQPAPGPLRLYRLPEVISLVGLSKTEIYRRIKANRFPAGSRISHRVAVWKSTDIEEWQMTELAVADIMRK